MAHEITLEKGEDIIQGSFKDRKRRLRLDRLAAEYVIDFDTLASAARAGVTASFARGAMRDAYFHQVLQERIDMCDPDAVITRQELLFALKREGMSGGQAGARVSALVHLARLLNMDPATKSEVAMTTPVINLTLEGQEPGTSGHELL